MTSTFQIDDGELDGLSAQECFVLGYELANVDHLLKAPVAMQMPVHAANQERIKSSCEDRGRACHLTWYSEDVSESWLWLEVDAE